MTLLNADRELSTRAAYGWATALLAVVWGTTLTDSLLVTFARITGVPPFVVGSSMQTAVETVLRALYCIAVGVLVPLMAVGATRLGLVRVDRRPVNASRVDPPTVAVLAMGMASALVHVMVALGVPRWHDRDISGRPVPPINPDDTVTQYAKSVASGFYEEPVLVAVIVLLLAARRPLWEMMAFTAVARIAFHANYGPAYYLGAAFLAAAFTWLWHRYRNLPTLVITHSLMNLLGTTLQGVQTGGAG